ncbi:hypothetical protein AC1031_000597 [Aphanomyces cochlioides]|nr:hypothetical protein AC1031_000597 [Aphanomyces cochlioides]
MPESVAVHVEGDALDPREELMLSDFIRTKKALGHPNTRRFGSNDDDNDVDMSPISRIVWIVKKSSNGTVDWDPRPTFDHLESISPCIDLVFLHEDTTDAQEVYDTLQELPWHDKAYCFEVDTTDRARIAKIFACLLSVPDQRDSQPKAETLMHLNDNDEDVH